MAEVIYNQEITDELCQSFLDYSMSVITDRSLPDVRTGLKPIHTKILYAANELGLKSDKAFRKSAKLVGQVIAELSPHGDEATYQAIVKLVQDFYLRYPLMLGEGAWGSQDGDDAAAYRYTLCKLSRYGELMLEDIKNDAVDFKPTFSNESTEPVVLPGLFPALICNGSSGIATGIAQKFAPHNLTEVCDAIIAYLNNNDITIKELMTYIKGPDFPTGCKVINKSQLEEFYEYGKGSIKLQGTYHFEIGKGKYSDIVFTEIPYGVSKEKVTEKIAALCSKGELTNIIDVHDDSTFKDGINYVIQTTLKSEEDLQNLTNLILDKTDLETSFAINQNAIVEGSPKLVNLKDMIFYYCQHQEQIVRRVSKNEKEKLLIQLEKLNGLLIALAHIEDIIQLIKTAENRAEAKQKLIATYKFTELQADTILDMKLARLTKIDGVEIKGKQEKINARLKELDAILNDESVLKQELIKKIEFMKKNYGDARRTEIVDLVRAKKSCKKDIIDEDTTVIISTKGDIKRINGYKKTAAATLSVINSNTSSVICIFTDKGNCYKIPVRKIPLVLKNSEKGEKLIDLGVAGEENLLLALDMTKMKGSLNIVTKNGYYKAIDLEECNSNRKCKFTTLKEDDIVVYCGNSKEVKLKSNKKDRIFKDFVLSKRTAVGTKKKNWEENEYIG